MAEHWRPVEGGDPYYDPFGPRYEMNEQGHVRLRPDLMVTLHGGYRDGEEIQVPGGENGIVLMPPGCHPPEMADPDWPKQPEKYDRRGQSRDFDFVGLATWTGVRCPEKEQAAGAALRQTLAMMPVPDKEE